MKRSAPLQRRAPLRRGASSLRRTRRRETKAEREARDRFNAIITEWPCFFIGRRSCETCDGEGTTGASTCPTCSGSGAHTCDGPLDAHHLAEKQWIRKYFGNLPEVELLAILFAPILGRSLCRYRAHDAVTRRRDRIYRHELEDDLIVFAQGVDERYPESPSLLGRLELENPEREADRG